MNKPSAMRFAVAGALALAVGIGIGRFAFTPILPMMQKDHGLTLRLAELLASVNYGRRGIQRCGLRHRAGRHLLPVLLLMSAVVLVPGQQGARAFEKGTGN